MALFAGSANAAEMTIAVFTKNATNPAYEAFRIAADQIARATGARVVHFVPKQPDNVDEQKAMVEQVLKDKPDAVIFIPVDDVAMIDSVKKLNDAQIPVVLVSNPLAGNFVTYVGADDFEIGYREARYLFDTMGGKGKIVVIEGTPAAPTNRERVRGYQRAFAEFPGIEVLGSGVGNYQQPDAKRVMEKFLGEHPQIDAVLSANDSMALGVLQALKEVNRTAIVISINGILPAVTDRSRRHPRIGRFQHVQDRLRRHARRGAPSQAGAVAGKSHSAGRGHRQDQLQGLAGSGRATQLPGMERRRQVKTSDGRRYPGRRRAPATI
jgi:ribose transport system substrate-binding protein